MSELPERKYFGCRSCAQVGQTHCQHPDNCGQVTEYIRADLVPAWHDNPTCEGVWLWDGRVETVVIYNGQMCMPALYSQRYYPCTAYSGKWFGPIPEEPK